MHNFHIFFQIFCPLTCKRGCGAPAGSARKREMQELEEYKRKKIKAAQEFRKPHIRFMFYCHCVHLLLRFAHPSLNG